MKKHQTTFKKTYQKTSKAHKTRQTYGFQLEVGLLPKVLSSSRRWPRHQAGDPRKVLWGGTVVLVLDKLKQDLPKNWHTFLSYNVGIAAIGTIPLIKNTISMGGIPSINLMGGLSLLYQHYMQILLKNTT